MAKGPLVQQHLAYAHSLAPRMDPKPQSQEPIHQLAARAALPVGKWKESSESKWERGGTRAKVTIQAHAQFFPTKQGRGGMRGEEQGREDVAG